MPFNTCSGQDRAPPSRLIRWVVVEVLRESEKLVDPIPNAVALFLQANIDSVDQLEILRLIAKNSEQEYSDVQLAKDLQISQELVESQVKALHSRGLLNLVSEQPLVFKYGTRSSEQEIPLQTLIQTYLERPVSLIKMVYENQKQMKLFSEAFRLKGDK
jgi:hypothetical protein